MTLFEYYLQYMTRICEGSLEAPEGIILTETDEVRRAMELQQQVGTMGIPAPYFPASREIRWGPGPAWW